MEESGVVLCLLRHYRLRLTAGLEEDDLVSVLDGVNDLDLRSSRVLGDSITVWLNTFILVEPHFYSDVTYSTDVVLLSTV